MDMSQTIYKSGTTTGRINNRLVTTALATSIFLSGTGIFLLDSASADSSKLSRSGTNLYPLKKVNVKSNSVVQNKPTKDQLELIRNNLKMTVSDIAATLDVSRQTIYDWINGNIPEENKRLQIVSLLNYSEQILNSKIAHPASILKIKYFDGFSFMDLIRQGNANQTLLNELINHAKTIDASYLKSNLSKAKVPRTSDWVTYAFIPGFSE